MYKLIILIIICFGFIFCKAQHVITLKNIKQNKAISIKLPASVMCTFKNGKHKQLLLEEVKGDSLIFKKYYNDTIVYDCSYNNLKSLRFHKIGDPIYTLGTLTFGTFTAMSASLVFVSIIIVSTTDIGAAGPGSGDAFAAFIILGVPLTIINGTITLLFAKGISKTLKTDKWALIKIK